MSILPQLQENRGTISSRLGKSLAQDVLQGDVEILAEAVTLLAHSDKNVRAGAAKIIEQVAVAQPQLVAGHLSDLFPALDAPEPQTRWMVLHTLGLCAALQPHIALRALPYAEAYIDAESGACLWGSAVIYLGYLGATSAQNARAVFPLLEHALHTIPGQAKNVLTAFLRMLDQIDGRERAVVAGYAAACTDHEKPTARKTARRLQKQIEVIDSVSLPRG
jgi:hypothetical protein